MFTLRLQPRDGPRPRASPPPAVPHPSARSRSRRPGFTLIEVMVVIVVIAVLATLVAPNVFRHVGSAKDATARSQIEMFGAALDAYRLDVGHYPTTAEGLDALWTQPADLTTNQWRGPYIKKAVPLDPWQHAYVYRSPGTESRTGYDLLSLGADGKPGGEGDDADLTSWK
jgi:general secretion pathway protein G